MSVCHPEVAQSQAQPTALQVGEGLHCSGVAGVVALQGAAGIRSFSGRQRQEHGTLHPHLAPVSYWGAAPQLQRNSSSFLQSAQWPGYGGQAHSPAFGPLGITSGKNHREEAEHEAANGTLFTTYQGLELCRKPSDISQA